MTFNTQITPETVGMLKACPFCGGEAVEFTENDSRIEPLVSGHPIDVFVDAEYAIAAWNRRPAATPGGK
jgi:hypothetical protein